MSHLFRVTARDHSAVILMTELAVGTGESADRSYRSLQDIAADMQISSGYLEEIAASLKSAGLIAGKQGPRGGYRLAKKPEDIRLADILTAIEGPITLVECQAKGSTCPVSGRCSSKRIWKQVQEKIQDTLTQVRLVDVI